MKTAQNWKEYELLDSGEGEKLERWGEITLVRPDPLAIWPKNLSQGDWSKADAHYKRSDEGGGSWRTRKELPGNWEIKYDDLRFIIKPTSFKHTGLFPEQATNWDSLVEVIRKEKREIHPRTNLYHKDIERIAKAEGELTEKKINTKENQDEIGAGVNVLNLFAYTGGATVALSKAGAKVCHVDSSKGIVGWAKENAELNGLEDKVRWIVDDAVKFVERELKRGIKYDGILMDPPSFGRGAKGEVWKLEKDLWPLVSKASKLLSDNPLFFHINSYTTGMSPTVIGNILESGLEKLGGKIEVDELGLKESKGNRILPQGVFGRWMR